MTARRALGALAAALAVALAAALSGTPAARSQGAVPRAPAPAVPPAGVDTLPSRDALEVLRTIPEPLTPSERVPAPGTPATPRAAADSTPPAAAGAARDSGAAGHAAGRRDTAAADSAAGRPAPAPPDTTAAGIARDSIPVPEPTRPLGERPEDRVEIPDSLLVPAAPPAPAAPAAAVPDTCWRVQFIAPAGRATADARRAAVESLFGVRAVVVREKGLHKVRTAECLGGTAARALRDRARLSGFEGAFTLAEPPAKGRP